MGTSGARAILGTMLLAGVILSPATAWSSDICEPFKRVVSHAGTGFTLLREKATHSSDSNKFFDAILALPRAKRCWVSETGDRQGRYWCQWEPSSAPAISAELRTLADGMAKCYAEAALSAGSSADEWWLSLPGVARVFLRADQRSTTIVMVIFPAK
jgi:hypothetical protein